jgi:uncharacterized membrane protein
MQIQLMIDLKNMAYAMAISGLIVIIIITLSGIYSYNNLIALITSYGIIVSSLIFMFGLIYNNLLLEDQTIFYKLTSLFPFIILITIILIILSYLFTYLNEFSSNNISNNYNTFSLLSTIFLASQIILLYNNITIDYSKYISNKIFSILTLLGTINFIIVITMGVILKFYMTDG